MRWHYRDAALLWLFPAAYLVHLAEEFWAGPGFPAWFAHVAGRPLPVTGFLAINALAFALLIAGTAAAVRHEEHGWIAVAVATIVSINALLHVAGSVLTSTYSPGLVSALVLYLPLGQLLLIRALHQVDFRRFSRGVVAGIAIHSGVVILAAGLARG